MSASNFDKPGKSKSKKPTNKIAKHTKGKETRISDEKFRGDGVTFKCKLLGVSEVAGPRGDNMCIEEIKKLKQHIKQTGDHKQKILLNITLKGIRIIDEKTKNFIFEHPVNKVSFITHDPEDKKIFSYICNTSGSHVMYAIKYDKVAGVITATIFELFQVVFKLRQEAANQKRALTSNQSNARESTAAITNGPSAASHLDGTNIYEEPKSSSSSLHTQEHDTSDTHYKIPPTRPLPPAPYATPPTKDSHQPGHNDVKTSQPQSLDSQASLFASDSLFSASVFTQADSASDTVSMSSVDIIRKESISSSSSETASIDTRSLDLKPGHLPATPPNSHSWHPCLANPAVACTEAPLGVDHNYETIPLSNYETTPSQAKEKDDAKIEFKGFKESFSDVEPFPRSDSLNDPLAANGTSLKDNHTSSVFDDDDLFKSFGDSNFSDIAIATSSSDFPVDDPFAPVEPQKSQSYSTDAVAPSSSDFPVDDPFAPVEPQKSQSYSTDAVAPSSSDFPVDDPFAPVEPQESQSYSTDAVAPSSSDFPVDDPFAPVEPQESQTYSTDAVAPSSSDFPVDDPFAPVELQESQSHSTDAFSSSYSFETAFGSNEKLFLHIAPSKGDGDTEFNLEGSSEKVSEEPTVENQGTEPVALTDHFEDKHEMAEASPPPSISTVNIQNNDEKVNDTAWAASAVKQNGSMSTDLENNNQKQSEKLSDMEFKWEDTFGIEKEPQSGSSDVKHEDSWSAAFENKQLQSEVSFSWDDAFGKPVDYSEEESKHSFGAVSFEDPFASTPLKESESSKPEPAFLDLAFGNFGAVPLDSAVQGHQKVSPQDPVKTEDSASDDVAVEIFSESKQGGFKEKLPNKETEDEPKPQLLDDKDVSSSSDKESDQENMKVTIQRRLEPISKSPSDNEISLENSAIPIQPIKPKQDVISSNVPPPLPPRAKAALPVLPPRPRTFSSPNQVPSTPQRLVGSSKKDVTKSKQPPALPPRIDLELGKAHSTLNLPGPLSISGFKPEAFSSPINNETSVSWQANCENKELKENNEKENVSNSKTSLDPFGDDFFTDFKDMSIKPNDAAQDNQDYFVDPFLEKEGSDNLFKADFGGEDPFAGFTLNNKGKKNDPFLSDGDSAFPGFSLSKDPFEDVSDPFAEKSAVNDDPFGGNPKGNEAENLSFQLSKDYSGDFADSFA